MISTTQCAVCGMFHATQEDRQRAMAGGNLTAWTVKVARQEALHYLHDYKLKANPPEYQI
jgi:hypothetical protein